MAAAASEDPALVRRALYDTTRLAGRPTASVPTLRLGTGAADAATGGRKGPQPRSHSRSRSRSRSRSPSPGAQGEEPTPQVQITIGGGVSHAKAQGRRRQRRRDASATAPAGASRFPLLPGWAVSAGLDQPSRVNTSSEFLAAWTRRKSLSLQLQNAERQLETAGSAFGMAASASESAGPVDDRRSLVERIETGPVDPYAALAAVSAQQKRKQHHPKGSHNQRKPKGLSAPLSPVAVPSPSGSPAAKPGSHLAELLSPTHPLAQKMPKVLHVSSQPSLTKQQSINRQAIRRMSVSLLGNSEVAASLHRGPLHPGLTLALERDAEIETALQRLPSEWKESRQLQQLIAEQAMGTQNHLAAQIIHQKQQRIREHDRIVNEPVKTEHAQRLLRTRIENNFRSLVRHWFQSRVGWALDHWKTYVRLHRQYQAWVKRVTPHAIAIQMHWRSWRGRVMFKAAREAARRELRRKAATKIQSQIRRVLATKRVAKVRAEALFRKQTQAQTDIARVYRGFRGRKRVNRICRNKLRERMQQIGFGKVSLVFQAVERNACRPEHATILMYACEMIRDGGGRGVGPHSYHAILDMIGQLHVLALEREADFHARAADALRERHERKAMHAVEVQQRELQAVLDVLAAEAAAEKKAIEDKIQRDAAEVDAIAARREAALEAARQAEIKRRADAKKELGRKQALLDAAAKAAAAEAAQARAREDAERKRRAKIVEAERKKQEKIETAHHKETLVHLKRIKFIKQQQQAWQADKEKKAKAAEKKREAQRRAREVAEAKQKQQLLQESLKIRARARGEPEPQPEPVAQPKKKLGAGMGGYGAKKKPVAPKT